MSKNAACIVAVIGASGSGKSRWLKSRIASDAVPRMLIWDPMDEYTMGRVFDCWRTLAKACVKAGEGAGVFVFRPGDRQETYAEKFERFCSIAFAWGECSVVAEELGDVTRAGWCPASWGAILRKGRHRGMRVYGVAQRPALMDKTIFGQATLIHCSRLNFDADIMTMAGVLGVKKEEVRELKADQATDTFEWIERAMGTGLTTRGTLPPSKRGRTAKKNQAS